MTGRRWPWEYDAMYNDEGEGRLLLVPSEVVLR